jgi:hypothetical protein
MMFRRIRNQSDCLRHTGSYRQGHRPRVAPDGTCLRPAHPKRNQRHTRLYSTRVKIAVSIPDPLFEAADQLARRRKVSRSQLYAIALERLLAAEDDHDVTERLNAVYTSNTPVQSEERPPRRVITVRESW